LVHGRDSLQAKKKVGSCLQEMVWQKRGHSILGITLTNFFYLLYLQRRSTTYIKEISNLMPVQLQPKLAALESPETVGLLCVKGLWVLKGYDRGLV